MSVPRLQRRTPSAEPIGICTLRNYQFRVHKVGMDGSAKCDAFYTGHANDRIEGVLFEIDPSEKPILDRAEGLGRGYNAKFVPLETQDDLPTEALIYVASKIDEMLLPFDWYMNHVIRGAREAGLSAAYCETLIGISTGKDPDKVREKREQQIYDSSP